MRARTRRGETAQEAVGHDRSASPKADEGCSSTSSFSELLRSAHRRGDGFASRNPTWPQNCRMGSPRRRTTSLQWAVLRSSSSVAGYAIPRRRRPNMMRRSASARSPAEERRRWYPHRPMCACSHRERRRVARTALDVVRRVWRCLPDGAESDVPNVPHVALAIQHLHTSSGGAERVEVDVADRLHRRVGSRASASAQAFRPKPVIDGSEGMIVCAPRGSRRS